MVYPGNSSPKHPVIGSCLLQIFFFHFGWANKNWLVVEPPIWTNARQHGNLPQIVVNIKKTCLKPPAKRKCYYQTYLMTVFLWVLALHSDTRNQPAKVYWINRTHNLSWQFHRIITTQKRQVELLRCPLLKVFLSKNCWKPFDRVIVGISARKVVNLCGAFWTKKEETSNQISSAGWKPLPPKKTHGEWKNGSLQDELPL